MPHLPTSSAEDSSRPDDIEDEDYQLPPFNPAPLSPFSKIWQRWAKPKAQEPASGPQGEVMAVRSVQGTSDDRQPVLDTSPFPYQSIACLELWGQAPRSARGTAWLMGPRILLTVAHNLYSPFFSKNQKDFAWARKVEITPGRTKGVSGFGKCRATALAIPRAYYEGGKKAIGSEHDFGAILIGKPFAKKLPDLRALTIVDPKLLVNHGVTVCGYPVSLLADESIEVTEPTQYEAEGGVDMVSPSGGVAYYQIDTSSGQSGAPIYLMHEGMYKAVGIHTYGKPKKSNHGTLITERVFRLIEQWVMLSASQSMSAGEDTMLQKLA